MGVLNLGTGEGADVKSALTAGKGAVIPSLKQAAANVASDPGTAAVRAGLPAAVGVIASVAADKLGVNKALAKAKAPFRI